ncbi:uncharacterized protein HKW66_Vig0047510 [Vigna angularis]|uniref:Uncharacterized protein n=1 Tax=Phaseolus angularis TaxID=3914 RepID=A0A8T0L0I7_PHAAN|nr:uncharacterized protein HKW66_Vig0047510 [Vigna angularis]
MTRDEGCLCAKWFARMEGGRGKLECAKTGLYMCCIGFRGAIETLSDLEARLELYRI